jgi:hypothetical protein
MDLNDILQTIIDFDEKKPWSIILSQLIFDSFRKFCIDYIQEPTDINWMSLYELTTAFTDEEFKKYIDEAFQAEHFQEFDTQDLCLEFFKSFTDTLVVIIKNDTKIEDRITDFLDFNIYKYFEIILSDNTDYYFFPKTFEDEMNIGVYEALRTKLNETPKSVITGEVINDAIENVEKLKVKSATHASLKRSHSKTKKSYNSVRQSIAFSKTRKQSAK